MVKLGVQGMTVKVAFNEDTYETMRKLSDIGYKSVEISQIDTTPENIQALKQACEDFGMEIASMSASLEPQTEGAESLTTDYDKIVADCKAVGTDLLRIGMLPLNYMSSLELVKEFATKANEYAVRLKSDGIKLYYHNHHIEFVKYDGKYLLDIIAEEAPDLGFEIDIHWVQRGGANPVDVLNQYKGRVDLVHLKDYRVNPIPQEAIDALFTGEMEPFNKYFYHNVEFAELGQGSLDLAKIIAAAIDSGARYLLVEQDDTYGRDPFESLAESYQWLVDNNYGDLF
ncbi:sugar phosphate isomerase/epimerase [Aerococcus agrisoli]|uniref:Sugar phosphate isomerase/epimerase n=1 Tax=Aerococcus agrisoli TaxID=2487350 RepID=A0A3N4G9M2_9LACT|nr:sugar phosphate isomerase/epimerase [Aerococcus agrisoli]RPA57276.1 sugar phosphate isomerase/epimerase [Aerococcus agrisoli]